MDFNLFCLYILIVCVMTLAATIANPVPCDWSQREEGA